MLERTSRFILEVFPYLSAALIAAVIVPGYLYSQVHGLRAAATPTFPAGNENAVEIIHWGARGVCASTRWPDPSPNVCKSGIPLKRK